MRISDWSTDVCSSDLASLRPGQAIVIIGGELLAIIIRHARYPAGGGIVPAGLLRLCNAILEPLAMTHDDLVHRVGAFEKLRRPRGSLGPIGFDERTLRLAIFAPRDLPRHIRSQARRVWK